jgi:hypothetical protein
MTVLEMHDMFREYAQRAGMQQVMDIRSEQIDVYLNNAVKTAVISRIQLSIQDSDSRSISTIVKTGQNNDFRTLFKTVDLNVISDLFNVDVDEYLSGKIKSKGEDWPITDSLIYYDYHICYCTVTGGWLRDGSKPVKTGDWVSELRRVRLIEHNYLGTTLADNILRPNVRNPIILTQSVDASEIKQELQLYFGAFKADGTLANSLSPYKLRVGYYRIPAIIHRGDDINEPDVNCDLPGHLHQEIVQRAIQDYQIAHGAVAPKQSSNNE